MTREQLKKLLRQIMNDVDMHGQVTSAVREEVERLSRESGNNSYTQQILNGRDGHDRAQRRQLLAE